MSAIVLGPYHVGEIPPAIVVTFKDSAGNAIDLTGYTGEFAYRSYGGAWVTNTSRVVVNANQTTNKGEVAYTWVASDFAAAGDMEAEMWVGKPAVPARFDSQRFAYQIRPAVVPSPTI